MADVSSLFIRVDSNGVVRASKNLKDLTKKAKDTAKSEDKLARSTDKASKATNRQNTSLVNASSS